MPGPHLGCEHYSVKHKDTKQDAEATADCLGGGRTGSPSLSTVIVVNLLKQEGCRNFTLFFGYVTGWPYKFQLLSRGRRNFYIWGSDFISCSVAVKARNISA